MFYSENQSDDIVHRATESLDDYSMDIVRITDYQWLDTGAYALLQNQTRHPLAKIIRGDASKGFTNLSGSSCAFRFKIEPGPSQDFVEIENICAFVSEYSSADLYESHYPLSMNNTTLFVISPDDPLTGKSREFCTVKKYMTNGQNAPWQGIHLEKGKPEEYVVRINPKKPGKYTFKVVLKVRHDNKIEEVTLMPLGTWYFE